MAGSADPTAQTQCDGLHSARKVLCGWRPRWSNVHEVPYLELLVSGLGCSLHTPYRTVVITISGDSALQLCVTYSRKAHSQPPQPSLNTLVRHGRPYEQNAKCTIQFSRRRLFQEVVLPKMEADFYTPPISRKKREEVTSSMSRCPQVS